MPGTQKITHMGRRLIAGFEGMEINDEIRFALRDLGAGGVILFARNYEEPAQLLDLTRRLQAMSIHKRLWIAVDQEGGKVQRFREPFTRWPQMAALGESGDAETARRFGVFCARELLAVGVDWNFAPVADVNTQKENPVIGRRSFSEDPRVVADLAVAVIQGLQGEGVMACAKHFPGHGDTTADSHTELPVLPHDEKRLEEVELPPFRAAMKAGVSSLMTAHVLYPSLDETFPATLSPRILEMARRDSYSGLIVTDDLEMDAVADRFSPEELGRLALAAGCDILLCCRRVDRQEALVKGAYDAVRAGKLSHQSILDVDRRMDKAMAAFPPRPRPPLSEIGRQEHQDLARLMGSR